VRSGAKPCIVCVIAAVALSAPCAARAATAVVTYAPFAPTGALAPGLTATPRAGGACATGSFVVGSPTVFRCVVGDAISDPCYLDPAMSAAGPPVVVCVPAPWATRVVRLRLVSPPVAALGLPAGGLPWALRLASGRRCVRTTGATSVVGGRRMNYVCDRRRVLFGRPDIARPTWRIRQARTAGGAAMRTVSVAAAWR
jgi:hypothetical protein